MQTYKEQILVLFIYFLVYFKREYVDLVNSMQNIFVKLIRRL